MGKFQYTEEEAAEARELFESQMDLVVPQSLQQPTCRDPDDDLVLGTAVAGGAEYIVTGDKDLLVLREYLGIKIVSPKEFFDAESEAS